MRLVKPTPAHLPAYVDALRRGWSPNSMRGADATAEELARIDADALGFLALMDDPLAQGPAVTLPDGTQRARIPGIRRWMWDDGLDDGFIGLISLRWTADGSPLPPHVLGHIGYTVTPWQRRKGHATQALRLLLPLAWAQGLRVVEITTDPDNRASQRVIEANGGRLVGPFDEGEAYGHKTGLRYEISA